MSHRRKVDENVTKDHGTIESLQKSVTSMKMINKELVLKIQSLKEDLASSSSHNCSLKAELYDMIMERNSLMEKNIKLVELLRSLQEDSISFGKRIDDVLGPRESERSRLSTKQSAVICPMVSGHVIHNPKVELRRLNFRDYPKGVLTQGDDAVSLSPVIEQRFEDSPKSKLGHRLKLSNNISNMRNREVSDESFYSVGSWAVEERNNSEATEPSTAAHSSGNLSSSTPNETVLQPGSDPSDPKPSGSRYPAEETTISDESERNSTSLLTINVMSPKNDPHSSSILLNPSVFVNVCPRKRKYTPEASSINGFTVSQIKEESNDESQDSSYTGVINLKYPIILSERLPDLFNGTLMVDTNGNIQKEKQLNNSQGGKTEIRRRSKTSFRNSRSVDESPENIKSNYLGKRRSIRSRKVVSYKE